MWRMRVVIMSVPCFYSACRYDTDATVFAFRAALVFGWVGEIDPPSRRMVNLSYMAWVWGGNLAVIAAFKLVDCVLPPPVRAPGAGATMIGAISGNQ